MVNGNVHGLSGEEREFILEKLGTDREEWDPDLFSSLCESAVGVKGSRPQLERFCSEVTRMEWRLLLDTCNRIVNPVGVQKG